MQQIACARIQQNVLAVAVAEAHDVPHHAPDGGGAREREPRRVPGGGLAPAAQEPAVQLRRQHR